MSIVNKSELAEILGKSERTLTTWQKNGLPIEIEGTRGVQHRYNTEDVIAWLLDREIINRIGEGVNPSEVYDYDLERARLTHHQANKTELEEQVLRGKLIPYQTVERVWMDMVANFRARILAIPTKAAHQFLQLEDLNEAQEILKTHCYEALTELADYEPSHYDIEPGPEDGDDSSAPALADNQRVG